MEIKPWRKVGEPKILASNHGRRLISQDFEDPYTRKIDEYSQFADATPFVSIVMPITPDNNVLAVRQYRKGADRIIVELPGGIPKTSQWSPVETALAELAEESTGYVPKTIISLSEAPLFFDPVSFSVPFYAFLAIGCVKTDSDSVPDEGEYVELLQIPVREWYSQCMSGQIVDAKSLAVTLLAQRFLLELLL